MLTKNQVVDFIKSKGAIGATFTEIQRFIVESNGLNYDDKDSAGRRIHRGYWCNNLYGDSHQQGILRTFLKVNRHYISTDWCSTSLPPAKKFTIIAS